MVKKIVLISSKEINLKKIHNSKNIAPSLTIFKGTISSHFSIVNRIFSIALITIIVWSAYFLHMADSPAFI